MTPEETPTADDILGAFFAEAEPPARDFAFQAEVAERIARRRALAAVAALVPWTIAAIALCWSLGPLVWPVVEGLSQTLAPAVAILTTTALAVAVLMASARRLRTI